MVHLIDKDALVAEIEKLKGQLLYGSCSSQISMQTYCKEEAYNEVLSCLDTLEVKEMDLEKEYKDFIKNDNGRSMFETAKHFFELGIKAQKGE